MKNEPIIAVMSINSAKLNPQFPLLGKTLDRSNKPLNEMCTSRFFYSNDNSLSS